MNKNKSKVNLVYEDKSHVAQNLSAKQLFYIGVLTHDFSLISQYLKSDEIKTQSPVDIKFSSEHVSKPMFDVFENLLSTFQTPKNNFKNYKKVSFNEIMAYFNKPDMIERFNLINNSNNHLSGMLHSSNAGSIMSFGLLYDNPKLFKIGAFMGHWEYLKNLSRYRSLGTIADKYALFEKSNDIHLNVLRESLSSNLSNIVLKYDIYPSKIINKHIIPNLSNHKKQKSFKNQYAFEIAAINSNEIAVSEFLLDNNKHKKPFAALADIGLFFIKNKQYNNWYKTENLFKKLANFHNKKPLIVFNLEEIENQEITSFILDLPYLKDQVLDYIKNNYLKVKCNALLLDFYLSNKKMTDVEGVNIEESIVRAIQKDEKIECNNMLSVLQKLDNDPKINEYKKAHLVFDTLKMLSKKHPQFFEQMMENSLDNTIHKSYPDLLEYWNQIKIEHLIFDKPKKPRVIL